MAVIRIETEIGAPPAVCFDAARSIELHIASTGRTQERAIGGVTAGLIGAGQEVTWSARLAADPGETCRRRGGD
jgi:hypothetical protein